MKRWSQYFPGLDFHHLDDKYKKKISESELPWICWRLSRIKQLPQKAKLVYIAYIYYFQLLSKTDQNTPPTSDGQAE